MRNLKLIEKRKCNNISEISHGLFIAFDNDIGVTYIATRSQIISFSPNTGKIIAIISVREDATAEDCVPVGLQYLYDQEAVCVGLSDGRICLWNTSDPEKLECVGEVDGGLTAMAWSPDLEVIIITTGQGKLLLMTREFDVITEVHMYPDNEGEDSNISVGWGKKETQFHGSAGKQAAKVEQVLVQPAGDRDTGKPEISWRGDGQFFVVSAVDPKTRGRFLYTWSRECVFQAQSEPVPGLHHALSWKPSGSLIASVQTKNHTDVQDVVFFEKNGLRHGEFSIPLKAGSDNYVVSLLWSQDSSVLALWIDDHGTGSDIPTSHLQLWTVNNYHWYLKQSLVFDCGIAILSWDTEQAYKMHLVTKDSAYLSYTWAWTTDRTSGSHELDLSLVAVIDGAQLMVTPVRQMVVPPPMAAYTLTLPCPANSVTFDPRPGINGIACLMANGQVAVFRYDDVAGENRSENVKFDAAGGGGFKPQCDLPILSGIYEIKQDKHSSYPYNVHHFLWLSSSQFLFTTISDSASSSILYLGSISQEENVIVVKKSFPTESYIVGVATNELTCHVAVQLSTGNILKLVPDTESLQPWLNSSGNAVKFPYLCTEMAVTCLGSEEVVLGLTDRFRFYVNSVEVASNCTSFGIHNEFLLLTTLSHTLRCISRSTKLSDLPKLSDGKAHPFDESIRRVERGSRIVTVVGDSTKVVLQMPRGNLETLHPRALVLSSLKHILDSGKILDAFLIMRKHRINLNLLYDHNPLYFIENIDSIISQISNQSYLNVFLTDLVEDDVTCTMYTASYQRDNTIITLRNVGSKIDRICDAVLASFQRLGESRYLQSVLSALVRKTKPALEEALLLIWSLHGKTQSSTNATAEDALKYLLFLVDVNALYDVALGTYNFDLVMMVAEKSQKDPKEYIPFLNQLRRLEENYRYYTIDKHLKKYDKALEHISKCDKEHFEECVSLVTEHKLYAKALRFYKPGTEEYKSLAVLYGNYLHTKNRHDEAGIMFLKGEELELAIESFRAANDWQRVFCIASSLGYSGKKLSEIAGKVAGDLKNRQRFAEAAIVLEQYAQDSEEAIVALIEGSHWEEALRLIYHYKRLDLIETHLKESLEESWSHHMDMLAGQKEQFNKYKTRLTVVKVQKEKSKAFLLETQTDHNEADADLFSDTTSMTGTYVASISTTNSSRSTVFTKNTGSTRTRRKAENKKWSLKEGSANEEYALVDALAKIIKAVDSLKEEITSLMKMLVQFNFDEKACTLQIQYSDLLNILQTSIGEIWNYSQISQESMNLGPTSTANTIAQAMQKGQKPYMEEEKLDPVLLMPPALNKDTKWKLHITSDTARS